MNFNDKRLLVLEPAPPLQGWLNSLFQAAKQAKAKRPEYHLTIPENVSLEDMKYDSTCYVLPALPPEEIASYLEQHTEELFSTELSAWCKEKEFWPTLNFANFASSFKLNFYFDWMNFQEREISESEKNLPAILLLIKPTALMKEYLRPLLLEKFKVAPKDLEKRLDLHLIQNGSTAVITDINSLDDVKYFIDQHYEEIFTHQLLLWGGSDSQKFWPENINLRTFKEWFTIEVHRHTHFMTH